MDSTMTADSFYGTDHNLVEEKLEDKSSNYYYDDMEEEYLLSDEFYEKYGHTNWSEYQFLSTSIDTMRGWAIGVYTTLFVIGLAGNIWVACVHGSVWRHTRGNASNEAPRAVQIYILALCFCDVIVLAFLSALISDLIYGQWVVPSPFLCRLYLSSESVNKFCSPFLLVAMSGYCYFSICKTPSSSTGSSSGVSIQNFIVYFRFLSMNETKTAITVVLASISLVFLLVSPVYVYGDLHYVVWLTVSAQNETRFIKIVTKCAFEPPGEMRSAFTIYSFIGGYLIPAASFTLFYSALLYKVRLQAAVMRRKSSEYFSRVAKTTTGLVLFYVLCWTPYWAMQLYHHHITSEQEPTHASLIFGYVIHTLPYINCTGYPILYTLMNRNIKEAYRKVTMIRRRETRLLSSAKSVKSDEGGTPL